MAEQNGYSPDRAVQASDIEGIARSLTAKLADLGLLYDTADDSRERVQSALEALIKEHGAEVYDMAWKNGNVVNRYDERDLGFLGAPGKAVQKRCYRLVLTIVPTRWSPRRS